MDVEQAERVQPGDVVVYQGVPHRVVAIAHAGMWKPYFELDDDDVVSHVVVEAPKIEASPSES